ncbi:MAG TPA: HAMP domain-containing protein [Candidatus Pullichristensenella stercorigallinarum]|uniref:histidine kinase n=1 Tax=Candidatus Pullichristensenella stercorigallinarum TaxID=2840909 RepID=A0A9D0ZM55_9FIRM|nr:HAMP domain-containing protein [Candidatus Pullichristensenella stercorigallinarum]
MNKNSSLVKRAIVFTAAIVSTMVVVTLLVYLLAFGRGGNALPLLWSVLVGLGAAAVVFYPLLKALISPVAEQVGRVRDVAVAVAKGDLDARADERVPGELGELGKALNNLSYQLSRNMYLLIIERNRLKQMLNGLSEGIVAVNAKGRVTHRNPALERMFPPEAQEHPPRDERLKLIPDRDIWADFDRVVSEGKVVTRNLETPERVLRVVISPLVDEIGTTAGAVGLFSDITQLERLERTRRDYVANVSHEMRTPLTAMRALIEPLKEGMVTTDEARMRYYDIILREIMRLSRLINDLMELSRLQSGTLAIRTERMKLGELVDDVCERYRSIAEDHDITFHEETDFSKVPAVVANADRVEQLLVILLDNAIKYTPEGGTVSLDATWDASRVTLIVKDTGIGISQEDLPYVFDRFYKVDKAHSGMGSGLGLSIAKELLKWMGEDIWVKSELGKGTQFGFTLRRDATA